MIRFPVALILALLLGACASNAPMPTETPLIEDLPLQLQVTRLDDPKESTLVLQQEGDALRWSQFDPMGVPLARQILRAGEWHADGLLPPNRDARELFAALAFALTDETQLDALYPDTDWRVDGNARALLEDGVPRWQATQDDDALVLVIHDKARYRITRLDPTTTP